MFAGVVHHPNPRRSLPRPSMTVAAVGRGLDGDLVELFDQLAFPLRREVPQAFAARGEQGLDYDALQRAADAVHQSDPGQLLRTLPPQLAAAQAQVAEWNRKIAEADRCYASSILSGSRSRADADAEHYQLHSGRQAAVAEVTRLSAQLRNAEDETRAALSEALHLEITRQTDEAHKAFRRAVADLLPQLAAMVGQLLRLRERLFELQDSCDRVANGRDAQYNRLTELPAVADAKV